MHFIVVIVILLKSLNPDSIVFECMKLREQFVKIKSIMLSLVFVMHVGSEMILFES